MAVAAEESEVKSDGTKIVTKPSRLQLARVSVLRGEGPMAGVPFIDDFILTYAWPLPSAPSSTSSSVQHSHLCCGRVGLSRWWIT